MTLPASMRLKYHDLRWCVLFVVVTASYIVLGNWLYATWRVPVGNTGLYAEGLAQIWQGHLSGYVSFIGTTLGADAGEYIAYVLAPVFGLAGFSGLWAVWGASVAVSIWLADRLLGEGATWSHRMVVFLVIVLNPFILANFVTSWDFDILFIPGVLLLRVLIRDCRPYWVIVLVAFLTSIIKDEAGLLLGVWAMFEVWHRERRQYYVVVGAIGVSTYSLGVIAARLLWPGTSSQIALHYANIGGNSGLKGILLFALHHPESIVAQLATHTSYAFSFIGASGGAMLYSSAGLAGWAVVAINSLGGGPLGMLMAHTNFEFTLMAIPFLILAVTNVLTKYPRLWSAVLTVWAIYGGIYAVGHQSYVSTATMTPRHVVAWDNLSSWYQSQPFPKPIVYAPNEAAAHFIGGAATGVGVDSLHQIATIAERKRVPLLIAYDPSLGNDGAPRRWMKRIAALAYHHDLVASSRWSHAGLHVYDLRVARFVSQGSTVTPLDLEILPWMWNKGELTLDLLPGKYLVQGSISSADGAIWGRPWLTVPPSAYLSPVVFVGHGQVVLRHR